MSQNVLAKKMKLKPGSRAAIVDAPDGYLAELEPLPADVHISSSLDGAFDWIQIFVRSRDALDTLAPKAIRARKPESMLWVSFPKGTSKIQTDLTRDVGWEAMQDCDLRWVNLVSVNATWSAFALRPYRPGEAKQT